MKKFFLFLSILTSIVYMGSCTSGSTHGTKNNHAQVVDSALIKAEQERAAAEQAKKEAEEKEHQEIIAKLSKNFKEGKDEFSDKVWINPINEPKYRNKNATYCYFMKVGDVVSNFRFVLQYEASDWLFIKDLIFNIDGEVFTYTGLKFERDNSGGRIWEWCDLSMNDAGLLKALTNAETVKIKMNGRQYYDTRTLSKKDLESIKNTIQYYMALGGKFKN